MEVDPEVAALLDDLPPTSLPRELREAGWGRDTMQQYINVGHHSVTPSEVQAPEFHDHCINCGRPITVKGSKFLDHAGREECDSALTDGQRRPWHYSSDDTEAIRSINEMTKLDLTIRTQLTPPKRQTLTGICEATRHHASCDHHCAHEAGHFGFHECTFCRHIWH